MSTLKMQVNRYNFDSDELFLALDAFSDLVKSGIRPKLEFDGGHFCLEYRTPYLDMPDMSF